MAEQLSISVGVDPASGFLNTVYKPDVLQCLANLSNDEVFTPPDVVNEILDMLPQELFSDPQTRFLDPVSKSGVFLREIAKRLLEGLKDQIPDLQARMDHIFHNQLFGIAITELTSLLSRRSVYCSKNANSKWSVSTFDSPEGNIAFKRIAHTWENEKCKYCGASKSEYNRSGDLETHAYQFIHPGKVFENMKFDVIVGNPPYQLSDGGHGVSAKPLYHLFVEAARKLNPRYITMIIPSRWYAGGKGLDNFREMMLSDRRIQKIVDFTDSRECFSGVDVPGGICYFLWNQNYSGDCTIVNHHNGTVYSATRPLNEFDTFIRDSRAVSVVKKIASVTNKSMAGIVSSRKPFGLSTTARPHEKGDLQLRWNGGIGPFDSRYVSAGKEMIDKWKVMTSKTSFDHAGQPDKDGTRKVLSRIEILPPGTVCTESYIIVNSFASKEEAENCVSFLKTKFTRFLISLLSFSQDITRDRFAFVPVVDFSMWWDDERLYKQYALTVEEIAFVESMIRPMD